MAVVNCHGIVDWLVLCLSAKGLGVLVCVLCMMVRDVFLEGSIREEESVWVGGTVVV